MAKISNPWSARQQHHLAYISKFMTDIRHLQGKDDHVADVLSKATISAVQDGIDYSAMATAQQGDPAFHAYCTAISSLKLENVPFGPGNITLLYNTSTG